MNGTQHQEEFKDENVNAYREDLFLYLLFLVQEENEFIDDYGFYFIVKNMATC